MIAADYLQDPNTAATFDGNLWVTRKGATSARKDQLGIIPGSMGVGSYITRGKGNPGSWNSCSHGAGRKMSRTKARKEIMQVRPQNPCCGVECSAAPSIGWDQLGHFFCAVCMAAVKLCDMNCCLKNVELHHAPIHRAWLDLECLCSDADPDSLEDEKYLRKKFYLVVSVIDSKTTSVSHLAPP